jgi:hypothetical protein
MKLWTSGGTSILAAVGMLPLTLSDAFLTLPHPASRNPSFRLFANSKNIRAAMEATERYGIASPEARLAWEVVEEFDARTNDNAAYTPNEANRLSHEQMANAYAELQHTLQMMERRRHQFQQNAQLMKDVAAELQAIKLSPPTKKPAPKIPGLWDAKLKARAISQQYGNGSVEAKLAWEEVEEIAAAGLENALGDGLSAETCDLVQASEACMAFEELDRFLYFENQQWDESNGYNHNGNQQWNESAANTYDQNQQWNENNTGNTSYFQQD